MKNTVIEFFQNLPENKPEQFNKAFEFYRQSHNKSESAERVYNATGFSELNLNNLLYDLQKLHGISDIERLPVEKIESDVVDTDPKLYQMLFKLVDATPEELNAWIEEMKESFIVPEFVSNLNQLLEVAKNSNNEKGVEVIEQIITTVSSPVIELSDLEKEQNTLLIELESYTEDQIDYWIKSRLETVGYEVVLIHLSELLSFAKKVNNEKRTEIVKDIMVSIASHMIKTDFTDNDNAKKDLLLSENQDLQNDNDDLNSENDDLKDENEDLKNQLQESVKLPKASAESIRVEFPFLNDKECPNELKILVADKITVWNEYVEIQDRIGKANTGDLTIEKNELETMAQRAIECFEENQKIYDELNAYKETGKILGKHKLFRTLQLTREVEAMTTDELIKYKGSTSKFFTDNKKKIDIATKKKDLERVAELNAKIEERTERLALVNKKLGV